MAKRRMFNSGYGSAPLPKGNSGGFPLPPPPDGKPPVRLPLGQGDPQQPAPVEDQGGQADQEMLMRLIQQLGGRQDQQ
jgi:hypothetical protein